METDAWVFHTHDCDTCGALIGCAKSCTVWRRTFWQWICGRLPVGARGGVCLPCVDVRIERIAAVLADHQAAFDALEGRADG